MTLNPRNPRPPPADEAINQRICDRLAQREVGACVSCLIDHFAKHPQALDGSDYSWEEDLLPLCAQDDWRATWQDHQASRDTRDDDACPDDDQEPEDYRQACEEAGIDEPFRNEAYEHWIVSGWFGAKLAAQGEMVGELFGLTIWGRSATGQAISLDGVIVSIAHEMEILAGQPYEWRD